MSEGVSLATAEVSSGVTAADVECLVCNNRDCVREGGQYRCLDCGLYMEQAPTGDLVTSVPLWWIAHIGFGVMLGVAIPAITLWAIARGQLLVAAFDVLLWAVVARAHGPRLLNAARELSGGLP